MESANKIPKEKIIGIKELLANTALAQLEKGEDMFEFANTMVEFGYIYLRNNDFEGLFKVITDKKTVYFAAQQGRLMRLNDTFNEEMFQETIQQMESFHGDWK